MKMMTPDVISHENQLQHLSEPSIFILDVFRTADHAGQIFIPHRTYYHAGRILIPHWRRANSFCCIDRVRGGKPSSFFEK